MSGLGEAVMITWAEYGLKIENTSETTESLVIYALFQSIATKEMQKALKWLLWISQNDLRP